MIKNILLYCPPNENLNETKTKGCIKFLTPGGGGESVGEEYQVVKRGREYHDCGDEYNLERQCCGSVSFLYGSCSKSALKPEEKNKL